MFNCVGRFTESIKLGISGITHAVQQSTCGRYVYKAYEVGTSIFSPEVRATIKKAAWVSFGIWAAYNLFDQGLANLLGLETFTHGTGPIGYIGINWSGGDPDFGGTEYGSSITADASMRFPSFQDSARNYFHVFKDTECPEEYGTTLMELVARVGLVRLNTILPRMHAILSGAANFPKMPILGGILGALVPTLRFRFAPKELQSLNIPPELLREDQCPMLSTRFEDDPYYNRWAYRTQQRIPSRHIGLTGTITQGLNGEAWKRMHLYPTKVATGIGQLTLCAVIAKMTYDHYVKRVCVAPPAQTWCQWTKRRIRDISWLLVAAFIYLQVV